MDSIKKNRIILIVLIVLLAVLMGVFMLLPEYQYSRVLDLTKDQNKILFTDLPTLSSKKQSDGLYDYSFVVSVVNTTDTDLKNVQFNIYLDDEDGQEYVIQCEAIDLAAGVEVEQPYQADLEVYCNSITGMTASIDGGEEFTVINRDNIDAGNPLYTAVAVLFCVDMIAVIVLAVRNAKHAKKKSEIELKEYENRAPEIIDLEIRKERIAVEQAERQLGIDPTTNIQQNIETVTSNTTNVPREQLPKIQCAYCGNLNDANADKCSVCGADLKK